MVFVLISLLEEDGSLKSNCICKRPDNGGEDDWIIYLNRKRLDNYETPHTFKFLEETLQDPNQTNEIRRAKARVITEEEAHMILFEENGHLHF